MGLLQKLPILFLAV
uniref:Uncharacterized protein n=1 Tax=Rhizophora mucronata TaxID=61149 RepID=A0A2P2PE16_RHIMU